MLNLFAPINRLGVGTHAYGLAKAYTDLGNDICLIPPFGPVRFSDEYVQTWLKNRRRFSQNDPSLMIFDCGFLTQFCGTPRIGFAVFETDGFPLDQLAAIKSCDLVLTPSEWGKRVLALHGIRAYVVNEGFNPEIFPVSFEPRDDNDRFRFIHVGKLEERKGTTQVIRCFFKALEREHAELVLHCQNPFLPDAGLREAANELFQCGFSMVTERKYVRAGLIVILTGEVESMSSLYGASDCGIFPSKGEGWGLPIMECIASGVPAIVGDWTGQSEYIGLSYPEVLKIKDAHIETANDGKWFFGNSGEWYATSDNELTAIIRSAFNMARDLRKSDMWASEVGRIRKFTWTRAALQLQEFMKGIL